MAALGKARAREVEAGAEAEGVKGATERARAVLWSPLRAPESIAGVDWAEAALGDVSFIVQADGSTVTYMRHV